MNVLQATELKKYYGAEPNITKALDDVTLAIEQGEFVAIVGTSGSGKSTKTCQTVGKSACSSTTSASVRKTFS